MQLLSASENTPATDWNFLSRSGHKYAAAQAINYLSRGSARSDSTLACVCEVNRLRWALGDKLRQDGMEAGRRLVPGSSVHQAYGEK